MKAPNGNGKVWLLGIGTALLLAGALGAAGIARAQWEQVDENTATIAVQNAHLESLRKTVDRIDENVSKLLERKPDKGG